MNQYKHEQPSLFNFPNEVVIEPIEVVIEQSCTVKRAAALIERSKSAVYNALRQKQTYRCQVTTGEWRVSYQAKENKPIVVKVTFACSLTQKVG